MITQRYVVRYHYIRYAEDTQVGLSFLSDPAPQSQSFPKACLQFSDWMQVNQLKLNPDKTELILVCKRLALGRWGEGLRDPSEWSLMGFSFPLSLGPAALGYFLLYMGLLLKTVQKLQQAQNSMGCLPTGMGHQEHIAPVSALEPHHFLGKIQGSGFDL